jgi:hypothetical protein
MSTKFDLAPRCSARSSRTGELCRKAACRGLTVCATHGGSSRSSRAKRAAFDAERQIVRDLARFERDMRLAEEAQALQTRDARSLRRQAAEFARRAEALTKAADQIEERGAK